MGLSRKRQRELVKLRAHAETVWDDQKDVLEEASRVIREASRQAANYAREEVSPRVKETFDSRVRPAVASGIASGVSASRTVTAGARERITEDVLPAVSSALGSALAVLEVAKDPNVRAALKRVGSAGDAISKQGSKVTKNLSKKVPVVQPAPSHGAGRYILIGIGVVALVGVAYAAWQTLRADDDLWIDDDELTEQSGDIQPS